MFSVFFYFTYNELNAQLVNESFSFEKLKENTMNIFYDVIENVSLVRLEKMCF